MQGSGSVLGVFRHESVACVLINGDGVELVVETKAELKGEDINPSRNGCQCFSVLGV